MKKKILLSLTTCLGIVLIILMYAMGENEKMEKDKINLLFEKNISKMKIRQSVDLPEYIEFSDDEMITDVKKYFKNIKINNVCKTKKNLDGGGYVIKVFFEDKSELSIVLREKEIKINETVYQIELIGTEQLFEIYRNGLDKGYLKNNSR